nr:DUF2062 domain-containing protein [Desulfobulbaceae bacterium]
MLAPKRLLKYYYVKLIRLKGDPRTIARGIALGTFVGITPTMPLKTVALLVLIPIFRANFVAAFLSSALMSNPLTYFPQYYLSWLIGNALIPANLSWDRISSVMDIVFSDAGITDILRSFSQLGADTAIVLVVGGFILATPFTIAAYFFSLKFLIALRQKKREKQILN